MRGDKQLSLFVGMFFIFFGVYLSIIHHDPHFFTFFSIGLLIVSLLAYNYFSEKVFFEGWNFKKIILFFIVIFVVSVIIDKIGLSLGYWIYPHYSSISDEVLKYIFEWTFPLIGYMIIFMTSSTLFYKLFFVLLAGFITEYVNSFASSWQVLAMPILNYNLGAFNLGFVTFGYWLMALIPYSVYYFITRRIVCN